MGLLLGRLWKLILPVRVGHDARVIEIEAMGAEIQRLIAVIAARTTRLGLLVLTRGRGHILLLLLRVLSLRLRLLTMLLLLMLHRDFLRVPLLLLEAHELLLRGPEGLRLWVRRGNERRVCLLELLLLMVMLLLLPLLLLLLLRLL